MKAEMTPESWQRVSDILSQALDLDTRERMAFAESRCGPDTALLKEVRSLLGYSFDTVAAVPSSPDASGTDEPLMPSAQPDVPSDPNEGRRIGPYRISRRVAAGGMGSVYLATREGDFEQQVALKLIHDEMASASFVARFHNERQILAELEHPFIARILDGGTTENGLPFFTMEYVDGEPIDRYCQSRDLSIQDRLHLFRKVCEAVQMAHQHLIVHRDIKPGNILVTGEGIPKLLDFGIAKLLSSEASFQSFQTAPGAAPMTLRFAAPEQIRGKPIATATDTYALGVLLYQLLTDQSPYRNETSVLEITRSICEIEPEKPSTAIRRVLESSSQEMAASDSPKTENLATQVLAARLEDPSSSDSTALPFQPQEIRRLKKLRRHLKGDLDSIALKALRKEPNQRYGSVEQMSEDIRRHLEGLPVHAHEGTRLYLARKLVLRHKKTLAVLISMMISVCVAVFQWSLAVEQREQALSAQAEALTAEKQAEAALDFMKDLFRSFDPNEAVKGSTEPYDLVAEGLQRLKSEQDLGVKAAMSETLGDVYISLGDYSTAESLLRQSLELYRQEYGSTHNMVARAMSNLASQLFRLGRDEQATELFQQTYEMRLALGQRPIDIARTLCNRASALAIRDPFGKAEAYYLQCLQIRLEIYGLKADDSPQVATVRRNLGVLYYLQGRLDLADPLLNQALDTRRRVLNPQHTKVADVLTALGRLKLARGSVEDARSLLEEAHHIRKNRLDESHPMMALIEKDLAELYLAEGSPRKARELLDHALPILLEKYGLFSGYVAEAKSLMGLAAAQEGRYTEAETWLIEGFENLRDARGPRTFLTLKARDRLVFLYDAWGKPELGQPYELPQVDPVSSSNGPAHTGEG